MSLTKTTSALFSAIVITLAFSSFANAIVITPPPPPPTELPEPGTLALFGFGLLGLVLARRRTQ